jgi:hypothetical protein
LWRVGRILREPDAADPVGIVEVEPIPAATL